jgi:hypothetical protein
MTRFQKNAALLLLIAAIGVALYKGKQAGDTRAELQKLQGQQMPLAKEIVELQAGLAGLTSQHASLQEDNSRLKNPSETELLQLRSEVARLRPLQDEVATLQKTLKHTSAGVAQWQTNELANVGRATAVDALQTYVYSTHSDPPKIRSSFVGDDIDPPSDEAIQKFIKETIEHHITLIDMNIVGYRILSQSSLASDKVRMELGILSTGGMGISFPITLRKIDSEWKLVLFNVRDRQGVLHELALIKEAPWQ